MSGIITEIERRHPEIRVAEERPEQAWRDEELEAGLREQAWYRSYDELWGVMRTVNASVMSGGWAYWLFWALLLPMYFGFWGLRGGR